MTSTVRSLAPTYPVIEVVHSGAVSVSDIQHVAAQARDLIASTGEHLVLTDWTDATSTPGNIAIISFGEAMDREKLPEGFRHAHVWPRDDSARLSMDMWKTVENLHHHQARAFGDRESAIAWLTE